MKNILYFLFAMPLLFACNKDGNGNIVGRWDLEHIFDTNGDEVIGSDFDCIKESYLVFDANGTCDFYSYYQDGANEPCGLDLIIPCDWYEQSNSSDYTLQINGQSANLSIDGDTMTQEDVSGTLIYVRH